MGGIRNRAMQIRVKANRMISPVVLLNVAAIEEKDDRIVFYGKDSVVRNVAKDGLELMELVGITEEREKGTE